MYGYIYMVHNRINGKKYIGKKKSNVFLGEKYLGSGIHITNAVNLYGIENFYVEQLDTAENLVELNKKEKYYINLYNAVISEDFYNLAPGGDGGCVWGDPTKHPSIGLDRSGAKNPAFGRRWYTNGIDTIYLAADDDIPEGYYKGSGRAPSKGRITIYKDDVRKGVKPEELDDYLRCGWITAEDKREKKKQEQRLQKIEAKNKLKQEQELIKAAQKKEKKKRVSWAKGLTKETDERIRKCAESNTGKSKKGGWKQSETQKQKASLTHKGKVVSEETRRKISENIKNMSEEKRKNRASALSVINKNKCWVANEHEFLRINLSELDSYLARGYKRQRKLVDKNS